MDKTTKELVKSVSNWLERPIESDAQQAISTANAFVSRLKDSLQLDPSTRKELGALIGRVNGTQKAIENMEMVHWVPVAHGQVAIGHRPSAKLGTDLKLQNATHMLTLLSEGEQAKSMESIARKNGLAWLWFPMTSAQPPTQDRYQELIDLFKQMKEVLEKSGKIYIHCSAGIHRTGMISFALLRFLGMNAEEALQALMNLRTTTRDGVGEERVEWANAFIKHFSER